MTVRSDPAGEPGHQVSARWAAWRARVDLDDYDTRWDRQRSAGHDVDGEADLVASFRPGTVLDAGCGTGRVAIELARRGIDVVGVDLDDDLLAYARRRAPDLSWRCADLAALDVGRRFDVVVLAGNVVNFCRPDSLAAIVATLADHLVAGGRLIAGFSIEPDGVTTNADRYLHSCRSAGLVEEFRWSGWDRRAFEPSGDYALLVHRHPDLSPDRNRPAG